jgi:O-antigen ligase
MLDPSYDGFIIAAWFLGLGYISFRSLAAKQSPWTSALIYGLAGWPILMNVVSPRAVTVDDYTGRAIVSASEFAPVLQFPAWLVMSLFVAYLAKNLAMRARIGLPGAGLGLIGSYMLFSLAPIISALVGEPGGGLTHALFRPQVVLGCVYFAANEEPDRFVRAAKWGCLTFVVGSLLAALVAPQWALIQEEGPSAFPRLYGLASHANGLAPVALMLLFLEHQAPSRLILRLAGCAAAVTVIVMSQSKTIWIASIVGVMILVVYRGTGQASTRRRWANRAVLTLSVIASVTLTAVSVKVDADEIRKVTLTGRTFLWDVALEEWRAKPLFGYGPTLWDEQYRRDKLGSDAVYAGHSHNMYVQQLAETGLVGFSFMLFFLAVLATTAWRVRFTSRGLSVALFSYLALRCVTESALSFGGLDESMLVGALVIGLMVIESARASARKVTPRAGVRPWEPAPGANSPMPVGHR